MVVLIVNNYTIKCKANVGLFMRNKNIHQTSFLTVCVTEKWSVHLIHIKRNGNPIWHVRYFRPRKVDFLFLRHFFEEKKPYARGQCFYCVRFFSSFPVDNNVKHCAISYILPLITKIFSRTVRWNTVLMY